MIKHVEGPIGFTALEPGCDLEGGGEVAGHQNAIRLTNGTEIVDTPDNLASFGRELVVTFGHNPPPITDPQILLVGRVSSGFKAYGPYPLCDDLGTGEAYDRIRFIEEEGSDDYAVLPIRPLTELNTLHGNDPEPPLRLGDGSKAPADASPAELDERDLPAEHYYFTVYKKGETDGSSFAIIQNELVESVDQLPDGQPDWPNAGIVDPAHGDPEFFHPAYSMLRYWNTTWQGVSGWHFSDHETLTAELRKAHATWVFSSADDTYSVHMQTGGEFVIRTPDEGLAFVAGMRASRDAK